MLSENQIYQRLRSHLAYLKLTTAAKQLAEHLDTAKKSKLSHTQFLARLEAEVSTTEQRRLDGRLRMASFPADKTLDGFHFDAQPGLDRSLVSELATLRFIDQKANALLIGPPGVGKTHLAIAIGRRAAEAGHRPTARRSRAAGRR